MKLTHRRTRIAFAAGTLWALASGAGCDGSGIVGGPQGGKGRRATFAAECSALNLVSSQELISIKNVTYFEASWLSNYRADECRKVAGCIIGRALQNGSSYNDVISAPYQFETYDAIRICSGGACYRITDGVGVDSADTLTRYGRSEPAGDALAGYAECSQAVEETLRNTPSTVHINFAAAGDGTNRFSNAAQYPEGCNLIEGTPAAPAPDSTTEDSPPADESGGGGDESG